MMNRYADLAVWHGSCFAIMEQIYKNNLEKGVAFPCLGVALLSFRCRIGGGMRHLKGVFPIKMSLFSGVIQKSVISAFLSSEAVSIAG